MASIKFPKKQEQRLIPKYLLEYATELEESHPDPTAEWGGSGSTYTAGTGIDITDSTISIDEEVVATKTDLEDYAKTEDIPTATSDLTNDSGYITNTVNDLSYYTLTADLATVATTGSYNDLSDTPTIPTATSDLTNDSGFITSSALSGYATETYVDEAIEALSIPTTTSELTNDSGFITNTVSDLTNYTLSSDLATVATTGSYNDLTDTPTIPTVDYPVTDVQVDGVSVLNGTVAEITMPTVPTKTSDLTNDSGFIDNTVSDLTNYTLTSDLATVATTGSYDDLSDKKIIEIPTTTGLFSSISGTLSSEDLTNIVANPAAYLLAVYNTNLA